MSTTRRPAEAEASIPVKSLAQDIRDQAAEIADEVAALLADIPDEQLFGDNEVRIRNLVLKLVAGSISARLDQKKTATSVPASNALNAAGPPDSTPIANEIR